LVARAGREKGGVGYKILYGEHAAGLDPGISGSGMRIGVPGYAKRVELREAHHPLLVFGTSEEFVKLDAE